MSRLGAALAAALLAAACVSSEPPSPAPRPLEGPLFVLTRGGEVRGNDVSFEMSDPRQRAALAQALARVAAASKNSPLTFRSQRGTPFATVEDLMALLEEAGVEDYRLELNAAR